MLNKFYDKNNKRLVLFLEKATPLFWDKHWAGNDLASRVRKGDRLVSRFTAKFLKPGDRILEGGCGIGQNVFKLQQMGYDVYGVDFAEETVKKTKELFPELKIEVQDVRHLSFEANFFDGYWSLGVIEHFQDGYEEIIKEAQRVIKKGGYFFLTFPQMSFLRKRKAEKGDYQLFDSRNMNMANFYEFILDPNRLIADCRKHGFELKLRSPFDALKGIKDEVNGLKFLGNIYRSKTITARGIKFLLSFFFSRLVGHAILLVFRKS